jgi:hypothetical protein
MVDRMLQRTSDVNGTPPEPGIGASTPRIARQSTEGASVDSPSVVEAPENTPEDSAADADDTRYDDIACTD